MTETQPPPRQLSSTEQQDNRFPEKAFLTRPLSWFLFTLLPQVLVFCIYVSVYTLVRSQISTQSQQAWLECALLAGFGILATFVYGYRLWSKQQKVSWQAVLTLLPASFILHYAFMSYYFSQIVPFQIPDWILHHNELLTLSLGLFTPQYLYAILVLVHHHIHVQKPAKMRHRGEQDDAFQDETQSHQNKLRSWPDLLKAGAIPLGWYLLFSVLSPLARYDIALPKNLLLITFFATGLMFFFFLLRSLVIFINQRKSPGTKKIVHVLFQLIFPLLGLMIYNGLFRELGKPPQVFGDLSSPWFYLLAAICGGSLLMPDPPETPESKTAWMARFFLRAATYPFTLYFFLLFLPMMPLSMLAIIAFGVGFLCLTPIVLMGLHTQALFIDLKALTTKGLRVPAFVLLLLGLCVIPGAITWNFAQDRLVLHQAMDHVFLQQAKQTPQAHIATPRLRRALDNLRNNLRRQRRGFGFELAEHRIPFLSTYYSWWVLDNLTLSRDKYTRLEAVYFGKPYQAPAPERTQSPSVQLTQLKHETTYDAQQQVYRSRIELSIYNHHTFNNQEYQTDFVLPPGTWVSNYSLWINGKEMRGALAEKRTALWAYRNIVNRHKDPGILYYMHGRRLALKVFPLSKKQTRRTAFELLHKEPIQFTLDGHNIKLSPQHNRKRRFQAKAPTSKPARPTRLTQAIRALRGTPNFTSIQTSARRGNAASTATTVASHNQPSSRPSQATTSRPTLPLPAGEARQYRQGPVLYLSRSAKQMLPRIRRQAYIHWVLDNSKYGAQFRQHYAQQMRQFMARHGFVAAQSRVTIANMSHRTYRWQQNWAEAMAYQPPEGGLFLTPVLKQALRQELTTPRKQYPIFVVLSPAPTQVLFPKGLPAWRFTYPESTDFYTLTPQGSLQRHSLRTGLYSGSGKKVAALHKTPYVRAWPNASTPRAFLADDRESSIVLLAPTAKWNWLSQRVKRALQQQHQAKMWSIGLLAHGLWLADQLGYTNHKTWVNIVRLSWHTNLLTPHTTYTVLENEMQWEALRRKQKQVLAGKSYLDLSSDVRGMPEPGFWLLLLGATAILYIRRRKNNPA